MSREELLKEYILKHYKSVREFCLQNNFPYSTVDSIFKRGLLQSSVSLIVRICDRLNIDIDSLVDGKISEKAPDIQFLTLKERSLIFAYRSNPSMQEAVDKLLGISSEAPSIGEDIASTVAAAVEKSTVKS